MRKLWSIEIRGLSQGHLANKLQNARLVVLVLHPYSTSGCLLAKYQGSERRQHERTWRVSYEGCRAFMGERMIERWAKSMITGSEAEIGREWLTEKGHILEESWKWDLIWKLNNHGTYSKSESGAKCWAFKQWGYFLETDMINTEIKKINTVFV